MNEPWSIPRASLGSITSNLSSNISSVKVHGKISHSNRGYHSEGSESESDERRQQSRGQNRSRQPSKTLIELQTKFDDFSSRRNNKNLENINNNNNNNVIPKRGSRSSQGSTDSNHSSHSATSGSLLLTAANLERFTQIHKKSATLNQQDKKKNEHYKTNITLLGNNKAGTEQSQQYIQNHHNKRDVTAISIDPHLLRLKATSKDVDSMSIASSTHFTVVNGVGGPQRVKSGGICSRTHQITVLIVSMSIIFLIGICGAVYLLEMRALKMPH